MLRDSTVSEKPEDHAQNRADVQKAIADMRHAGMAKRRRQMRAGAQSFAMHAWIASGLYLFIFGREIPLLSMTALAYFTVGCLFARFVFGEVGHTVDRIIMWVARQVSETPSRFSGLIVAGISLLVFVANGAAIFFFADWVLHI